MLAYNKSYVYDAQKRLGEALDYAVNGLKMNLSEFWSIFANSRYAAKMEIGDCELIFGMSGAELAEKVLDNKQYNRDYYSFERSEEYWLGYCLAYFQWKTCLSFKKMTEFVSIEELLSLYNPYHEMDVESFVTRVSEIINERKNMTNLMAMRIKRNLTRKELSELSNVPLRTIEQYEQRRNNINKASAEYVLAMARTLLCKPEELLELI